MGPQPATVALYFFDLLLFACFLWDLKAGVILVFKVENLGPESHDLGVEFLV